MKNVFRLTALAMSIMMLLIGFSSCQKDDLTNFTENKTETLGNQNVTFAAKKAYNKVNPNKRANTNNEDCDCFALFENIDWEADEEVVIAALEAILENLSEADLEALFTPVCTEDEIYENACIADCEGAVGYEACTDEQLEAWFEEEWGDGEGWEGDCEELCFEFNFPIQVQMPDGSIQTADTAEELEMIYETWYENNEGDTTAYPMLVFPIEVTLEDGSTLTLESEEDLEEQLETCFGEYEEEELEDCFAITYPVELVLPDGSTAMVNDDDALFEALDTWYEAHPDSEEFPTFTYPIEVTLEEDGTTQVIQNDEELDELLESCFEWEEEEFELCFDFNYPLTVVLPDGTSEAADDEEGLETIIDTWFDNHPDSEEFPTLDFPIEVTLEDGTAQTIHNEEELDALFESCFEGLISAGDALMAGRKAAVTKLAMKKK